MDIDGPFEEVVGSLESWRRSLLDLTITFLALAIARNCAFPFLKPFGIVAAVAMEVKPRILSKPGERSILLLHDRFWFRGSCLWALKVYANSHGSLLGVEGDDDRGEWYANLVGRLNLLGKANGERVAVDGRNLHLIDRNNGIGTGEVAIDAVPPIAFVLLVFRWTRINRVVACVAILDPSAWCVVLPKEIVASRRFDEERIADDVERLHDSVLGEPGFRVRAIGFAWLARAWVSAAELGTDIALDADVEAELTIVEITDAANRPASHRIKACSDWIETQ